MLQAVRIMKRTPLKRGTKGFDRSTKVRPRRPGPPRRVTVHRDRKYLDWLKQKECLIEQKSGTLSCGDPDPAHGPSSGMKVKGPDNGAVPLCRLHHMEQHQIGWPAFEAKYGFSRERESAKQYAAYLGKWTI